MGRPLVTFTETELRAAVASSRSFAETLRRLGMRAAGGNHRTARKYTERWGISTDHFDPYASSRGPRRVTPLEAILVEGSGYSRGHLKRRLLEEGVKEGRCELCGQGEEWRGRRMSLILDHVNGVHDDHRLENLRIVCPNCNATLETHCGKQLRRRFPPRPCLLCAGEFEPKYESQRYCSLACGSRRVRGYQPRPELRRAERPPYDELIAEIESVGYEAVGRRFGLSGNAVRKWRRVYELERREDAA